ncbi:hypothetical protein CDAR_472101 [Caerostris darwini]|uniref:Uncharacterized protein n=1 Tax=Caerostris darwini TaxID=1538125 RepID=A0AAV4VLD6_9ARAC|nr:hypothetical protein CDAR_472101 [Caerostris darwini]
MEPHIMTELAHSLAKKESFPNYYLTQLKQESGKKEKILRKTANQESYPRSYLPNDPFFAVCRERKEKFGTRLFYAVVLVPSGSCSGAKRFEES